MGPNPHKQTRTHTLPGQQERDMVEVITNLLDTPIPTQWQEGDLSQMTATPPEETLVPPPSTFRSLLEAQQFIPCSSAPPGEGRSGDLQSLWSAARASLTATSADITLTQDSVTLSTGQHKLTWDKRKDTSQALRVAIHTRYLEILKRSTDQGRAFHSVSLHPDSTFFMYTGAFLSFPQYHFIHRVRLNLLPV